MKRITALLLTVLIVALAFPLNVFVFAEGMPEVTIADTYVYEYERNEEGIFDGYRIKIIYSYSDGRVKEHYNTVYREGGFEYDYGHMYFSDTQDYTPWEIGGTYQVSYGDKLFNVEVRENPVIDVEIDDVTVCIYDSEAEKYIYSPTATVYFTDGTSERILCSNGINLYKDFGNETFCETEYFEYTDTQDEQPWVSGNTYEVSGTALGISDTFNVTVATIEAVEVEDVIYLQNVDGYWDGYYTEEDEWISDAWWRYEVAPKNITLRLTDGSTLSGDQYDLYYLTGFWASCDSNQSFENQWGIGEHTATLNLGGYTVEYTVEITDSFIQNIEIDTVSILQGTNGWTNHDPEMWYEYSVQPERITVTLKDGNVISGYYYDVCYETGFEGSYTSDQSFENQWGIGEHTATLNLGGYTAEYVVEIKAVPIQTIEIDDIKIIEGSHGYFEYGYYDIYSSNISGKVTFTNGNVQSFNYGQIDLDGYGYSVNSYYLQQDEAWAAGNTYEVTGTVLGFSGTFNVTIIENPIKSIEIDDVVMFEGSGDYFESGYYYIDPMDLNGTVTYKDGTSRIFKYGALGIEGEEFYVNADEYQLQEDEAWTAGNTYEVTGGVLGVSDTFNVTIVESPIENIFFEDIVLFEGIDSRDYGDYYYYRFTPKLTEVRTKDGGLLAIEDNGVTIDGKHQSAAWRDDQHNEPWSVGNTYQVTGHLLNASHTFNVTIAENPIDELQIIRTPEKTEYLQGESLNIKGLSIRVKYNDGSYEDVTIEDDYTSGYRRSIRLSHIDKRGDLYVFSDLNEVGAQTVKLEFFGKELDIHVTVKENLIESITLRENDDKSLVITVYNSDNTSYDMKILDICYCWPSDSGEYYSAVFTDKGEFGAMIFSDGNSFAIGLSEYSNGNLIKSNSIPSSDWFELMQYLSNNPMYWGLGHKYMLQHYNGKITAANIDAVIDIAFRTDDGDFFWNAEFASLSGEEVRKVVKKQFAVNDIDLSLSEFYDPQSDTYIYWDWVRAGGGEVMKWGPDQISYENGVWSVTTAVEGSPSEYYDEAKKTIYLKLDDDLRIISLDLYFMHVSQIDVLIATPVIGEELSSYYEPQIKAVGGNADAEFSVFGSWYSSTDGETFAYAERTDKFEEGKYYAFIIHGGYLPGVDQDTVWFCNSKPYSVENVGNLYDVCYITGPLGQSSPGDFDFDGKITVADALAALRIAAKMADETAEGIAIGDIDKDGTVTVADALAILRVAAKMSDSL